MNHLATFADGGFGMRQAGKRLVSQAQTFNNFFKTCVVYSLRDLDSFQPGFSFQNSSFIRDNPRGFGLCFWKPTFVLAALEGIPEGDILFCLDAGCQLNYSQDSLKRLEEYSSLAQKHRGLFMQLKDGQFGISNLTDRAWTNSLLQSEVLPSLQELDSNQVQAGILIVKNCVEVRVFMEMWKQYCETDNFKFLIGTEEDAGGQTRWEQSVFSLLVKKTKFKIIPDETYWFPNWNLGHEYPIWAMRNRSGGDAHKRRVRDLILILVARVERLLSR
jgi:hypothetical protein